MDLRQLRYFTTVVKEKNFSKAAGILHISQPSLSNSIMKLETEIGIQLLERNTRSLTLTESGEIFYTRAMDLIKKHEYMLKDLDEIRQTGSGMISIGLIESSKYWIPKTIKQFKKSYPNIEIHFKELLGHKQVLESLSNYDVHFTITNQPIHSDEIEVAPIYIENLLLVMHKDDELNRLVSISLNDLTEHDFIISTAGFQTRDDVLNAFQHENLTPNIMYEIERLETACSLVEHGLGIAILPESYVKYYSNPNLVTRSIDSRFLQRPVYIAFWKDRNLTPAVFHLIEEIQSLFV
ncbi:DNA-binding transcriptional LysR family regulator [Cytobacillus oceanisediminis]|uniref:DNA-binding transcriptional LysR family regulator n=1 Tax=Cytobacillus oceanisediminis TaxID=665099 RepID=A0A2V2ZZ64_9BACI|nr:LysR family transcriptional regulator [Cytobacillus oceanisediminis]PWW29408.1 DNA-binding transcriptional LysR family regulator [Cytobacillus oceanisediminis]